MAEPSSDRSRLLLFFDAENTVEASALPASHETLRPRAAAAKSGRSQAAKKPAPTPALKPRQILERARQNQQIAKELAKGLSMPEIQGIAVSGLVDGELRLLASGGEAASLVRFHEDAILEHMRASGFAATRIKVKIGYVRTPFFAPPPACRRQPLSAELRRSTLALAKCCSNPRLAALWKKIAHSKVVTPAADPSTKEDR